MAPNQTVVRNRLLRTMSADDFAMLAPHLVPRKAGKGFVLFHKDDPIDTVWFLESGIGSLIVISPEGHRVEAGLFGRDGFAPVAIALGSDRVSYEGLIQVADDCFRMEAGVLKEAMAKSPSLHFLLLRYAQTLSTQTVYTALSNAVHPIEERLARWLLMCHDRMDDDELPLTHEFLSIMLAVRRPSVTTALHVLEGNRLIRSERGIVVIRDRARLEEYAADGYGASEREYRRLVTPHL